MSFILAIDTACIIFAAFETASELNTILHIIPLGILCFRICSLTRKLDSVWNSSQREFIVNFVAPIKHLPCCLLK